MTKLCTEYLTPAGDVYGYYLVSDTYATIDANTLGALAELAIVPDGGNYVGGTTVANTSAGQVGNELSLRGDGVAIAKHASNPTTARCFVLVNKTVGNVPVVVHDLTADGLTPVDLTAGATSIATDGGAYFKVQVNA